MLDLRTLCPTIAAGVQVFIHRLFYVVKSSGVDGNEVSTEFSVKISSLQLDFLFESSLSIFLLEGESASCAGISFKWIFVFSITNCFLVVQL